MVALDSFRIDSSTFDRRIVYGIPNRVNPFRAKFQLGGGFLPLPPLANYYSSAYFAELFSNSVNRGYLVNACLNFAFES